MELNNSQDMLYQTNGKLGLLSVMGLGCWNFGAQWANKVSEEEAVNIIRYSIDNGINFVDVAESYGYPDGQCELILGKALKDGYREKVKIVDKIGWYGRRAKDFFYAKDSLFEKYSKKLFNKFYKKLYHYNDIDFQNRSSELLRLCGHACCGRLGVQTIDLLLCHDGAAKDLSVFITAFRQLKAEGFLTYYGISTDDVEVLKRFYVLSDGECAACEFDYSLLNRAPEEEIIPFCAEHKITMLARGSLGSGILSGKYDLNTTFNEPSRLAWNVGGNRRSEYEAKIATYKRITEIANGGAKIAYPFVFSNKHHVSAVIGVTSAEQIKENVQLCTSYMDDKMYDLLYALS